MVHINNGYAVLSSLDEFLPLNTMGRIANECVSKLDETFATAEKSTPGAPDIDYRAKLEKGVDFSAEELKKIEKVVNKVGFHGLSSGYHLRDVKVTFLSSSPHNYVFEIDGIANRIFKLTDPHTKIGKVSPEMRTQQRYANMVKALRVCKELGLDCLVVPHAKIIPGKYDVIAEEKLDLCEGEEIAENDREKVVAHIAQFIVHTDFSDVEYRNIPCVQKKGKMKIGLVDLEEMKGASIGLFGQSSPRRTGLINLDFAKQYAQRIREMASAIPGREK
jgi:hypothetical protein